MSGDMEINTNTTRRALFAAAPVLALGAAAMSSTAMAKPMSPQWRAFVTTMGWMHPNGERAAMNAYRSGVDLDDLFNITLFSGDERLEGHMPALLFKVGKDYRSFNPQGERA